MVVYRCKRARMRSGGHQSGKSPASMPCGSSAAAGAVKPVICQSLVLGDCCLYWTLLMAMRSSWNSAPACLAPCAAHAINVVVA